jgi:hypothetical protein
MSDDEVDQLLNDFVQQFHLCKQDPANLNQLYTLVGTLTMAVAYLIEQQRSSSK